MGFSNTKVAKSRLVLLLLTLTIFPIFIFLLNNVQENKFYNGLDQRASPLKLNKKTPGEYVKFLLPMQSKQSYCKLNYGLPSKLTYTDSDLEGTPELGLDSPFRVLYNVIQGRLEAHEAKVTYVTHLTKDFVNYLTEVIRYWEGSISVAVYVKDGDPTFILDQILHFCYCIPGMSRVSLHLVFPKHLHPTYRLSKQLPPSICNIPSEGKLITSVKTAHKNSDSDNNVSVNWYPINVCRNAAREAAITDYVLVCDIELMPSQGLASRFIKMMDKETCLGSECNKRIFVIPIFEVDSTEDIPLSKRQLISLLNRNQSVYFHQITCTNCQKFPGLDLWKETNPGNVIKPLIEAKREKPYTGWEPIYIGTKDEPLYYEKLSWEGFLDKMLQMMEMCLASYRFVILDGAFLVHWPGIKRTTRADEPWRNPYIEINKDIYNDVLMNVVVKKYPENKKCNAKML